MPILDTTGHYSDADIQTRAEQIAHFLLQAIASPLAERRIALLLPPSFEFVTALRGLWLAGGMAVPIALSHPEEAMRYTLTHAQASAILTNSHHLPKIQPLADALGIPVYLVADMPTAEAIALPALPERRRVLMLYTSGTTSRPKGVVWTNENLDFQCATLAKAWAWTAEDAILNVLPLHHVHGLVNALLCPLSVGATVEFLPKFSADAVWDILASGRISVFMAVPTIYFQLIQTWEERMSSDDQARYARAVGRLRLMVSGSAALPVSVLDRWRSISGHTLLERYGMTEIGMAISNPYAGERRAGNVGAPLPGVEVRLVEEDGRVIEQADLAGEIQVRGRGVFLEYWNNPEATAAAFTEDGWFRTGDVAVLERGYYRILGRLSTDIIKSGGYKLSALEIEEVVRQHPQVHDCAVYAIPNEEWGEVVGLALVGNVDLDAFQDWLRSVLPAYKVPRVIRILEELPRNAMGKVVKGAL